MSAAGASRATPVLPRHPTRALSMVCALACAAGGLWLALHHPLSGAIAAMLFGAVIAAMIRWPGAWLVALPAALPLLGLAPWTGWFAVEEVDLLVLAVAAGGYARWAVRPWPLKRGIDAGALLVTLCLALWCSSVSVSAWRGVVDAGGLDFDWYDSYSGPANALRLAKPTLAACLLLPLWSRLQALDAARAAQLLIWGLALGHGGASLACLYERLAYPGLLNFSADYRTTGLFWEMHVGGAALDAFLALTMPFAWQLWVAGRGRFSWLVGALITLLGVYATLTTFSRILLLAPPLMALVMLLLHRWGGKPAEAAAGLAGSTVSTRHWTTAAAFCVGVLVSAGVMFPSSGYRGMLALLGLAALLLVLLPAVRRLQTHEWIAAFAGSVPAAALLVGLSLWLPKGPYLAFALAAAATFYASLAARQASSSQRKLAIVACAGFGVTTWAMLAVAWHWGGAAGLEHALGPAAALVLAVLAASRQAPWPQSGRWKGGLFAAIATGCFVVGLFGGGAYMTDRLGAFASDREGRFSHWRDALNRVRGDDALWWGLGLGRFPDLFAISALGNDRPGYLRRIATEDGFAMRLSAGTHMQGWGELLRLSQRVPRPSGNLLVQLSVRGEVGTPVHAEVCIKHLLYDAGCAAGAARIPAGASGWTVIGFALGGNGLGSDDWYLPRFTVFSLATDSRQPIEVRQVSLTDARGQDLIANGRFVDGRARWFFSSDRNHLPWHAKNLWVHLLFEQGWFGLGALLTLTAMSLGVAIARARRHLLSPALVAGILGVWTVGLIDSVLDMPRVALVLLLLTTLGVMLKDNDKKERPKAITLP